MMSEKLCLVSGMSPRGSQSCGETELCNKRQTVMRVCLDYMDTCNLRGRILIYGEDPEGTAMNAGWGNRSLNEEVTF